MENEYNDPEFIPTAMELVYVVNEKVKGIITKSNQSHMNLALEILKKILYLMYGKEYMNNPVSLLREDANSEYKTPIIFNSYLSQVITNLGLAKNTCKSAFYALKKILCVIGFSENFVNRLGFNTEKSVPRHDMILKNKYGKMCDDSPVKKMLIKWIHLLRTKTKNRSPNTIKVLISFFSNICLPAFHVTIDDLANEKRNFSITQKIVDKICTSTYRYRWFNIFCETILGVTNVLKPNKILCESQNKCNFSSGDKHVITPDELDKIYIEAKKNIMDELIFLLLITTGMRIGGLLNIKISHICTINGNNIRVSRTGRTLEKGGKWFEFVINDRVQELIVLWLLTKRKGESDYLFSSSKNFGKQMASITTRIRFKKLCRMAGLSGDHLHLHSLRHSYAHMLLKCGNSVSVISKLLGHSNTDVTEKFYLRETISEITNRAFIPWIDQNEKRNEKILPDFLHIKNEQTIRKLKRLEYINSFSLIDNSV